MAVDGVRLSKGAPQFLGAGAPATAADENAMMYWGNLAVDRAVATIADLSTVTDDDPLYTGKITRVTACPGAWFRYNGGSWDMYGVAAFADATARGAAIPAPALGWISKLATELFPRIYNGSSWVPYGSRRFPILPSAATNGSVDAQGVVTSTAQSLVRVRDAFPSDFRMVYGEYDVTLSAAVGLLFTLAANATDATSAYDYQRTSAVSTTLATVQDLNQASGSLSPIGLATRHVGSFLIVDANFAGQTVWDASSVVAQNPMTTSSGKTWVGGSHRTASAYNSITLFGASGNITVNRLMLEGIA